MEELCRAIVKGEQSVSWLGFQAARIACAGLTEGASDELESEGDCAASMEVKAELENRALWKQFNEITNEMIITKAGRYA